MRTRTLKCIVLVNALTMLMLARAPLADGWKGIPLVKDLFVTLAARERMYTEFMGLQSSNRLSPVDRSDFQAYIDRLDLRIAQQCGEVLARHPDIDRRQLPCTPVNLPGSLPDPAAEQTPDEALAALDASLAEGLAEFDEMLLSEQKRITARPPRVSAASGYAATGDGDGDGDGDQRAGQWGTATGEEGQGADGRAEEERNRYGRTEDGSQSRTYGSGVGDKAGTRESPPEDVPDGSKDDVVARQLREAAEKEADPELKRKLWDEYRRYTASMH